MAGGIRSPSIEVTEERFPFFIERHELRPDSGGVGAWRGGLGAMCDLVYEGEGPALLNTAGDGVVVPPFGLFGAADGLPAPLQDRLRRRRTSVGVERSGCRGQPRRPHHLPFVGWGRLWPAGRQGRRSGWLGPEERICDGVKHSQCGPRYTD